MRKKLSAQSSIEYLVVLTVVLAAILSSGILGRIRNAFNIYFTTAAGKIVNTN
ncbi:MAG: hypothetical protein AABY28_04085 [Candidatus Omnitrophota bacterium]